MPVRFVARVALLALGMALLPNVVAATVDQQPQIIRLDDLGKPEAQLDGSWQFHAGDSPQAAGSTVPLWADPSFDDAGWQQVTANTLSDQNLPYTQFSWYRRRIEITRRDPAQPLAVFLRAADSFAVYWNGQPLGAHGDVPPRFNWPNRLSKAFPLPLESAQSVSGILAVRVWCQYPSSLEEDCGFLDPPWLGAAALEQAHSFDRYNRYFRAQYLNGLVGLLAFCGGLGAFLIYLRDRGQRLYLWFALFLLSSAVWQTDVLTELLPANWDQFVGMLTSSLLVASFLLLLATVLGLDREPRPRRIVPAVATLTMLDGFVGGVVGLFWAHAGPGMRVADGISSIFLQIVRLAPWSLLVFAIVRRRGRANWPVIATAGLYLLNANLVTLAYQWPGIMPAGAARLFWSIVQPRSIGPFDYSSGQIISVALLLTLSIAVCRHFFAERQRQLLVEQELQSAREIQQVLVPEAVPTIPGYAIDTIYRPVAEVGGDFFQILPLQGGAFLIAIGDVSGKGLKAAMIVALIVGTLRTIASYTQQPSEILAELNTRLHGRIANGFATCLILRVPQQGPLVIANAGHLAPYLNGRESELPGALPLGIIAQMEYEEASVTVAAGETVTLLTDGVPEAQSGKQLFGFDRLASLLSTHPSAAQIVEAACTFGQQDDITVLTLTRLAASAAAPDATLNLTTQLG